MDHYTYPVYRDVLVQSRHFHHLINKNNVLFPWWSYYIWTTWRVSYKRQEPEFTPGVLVGSVLLIFLDICVVPLCGFTFCCDVRYVFRIKTMFGSSLPPGVCRRAHVLLTLFVFACAYWCPTHTVLCFCFVFLRLVYPMLPVSLDCSFLIATSVFFNVYSLLIIHVTLTTIIDSLLVYYIEIKSVLLSCIRLPYNFISYLNSKLIYR